MAALLFQPGLAQADNNRVGCHHLMEEVAEGVIVKANILHNRIKKSQGIKGSFQSHVNEFIADMFRFLFPDFFVFY